MVLHYPSFHLPKRHTMSTLSTEYRPIVLPPGKTFHDLTPEQRLRVIYGHLDRLRQSNGGYIAAPVPADEDHETLGYDVLALQDLLFASTANEYLGEAERLLGTYSLTLQLLEKFHHRIIDAILRWPDPDEYSSHLFPDRFHPRSLAEMLDGGNGHRIFPVGMLLYKLGDMMKHGFNLVVRPAEIHLLKDLVQYAHNSRWATEPDEGFWREDLAMRSSSLGAVVAGMTMWQAGGYYDYRYPIHRDLDRLIPVPDRLVAEGRANLMELLPVESEGRDRDLAQLSLMWPFNVLKDDPDLQDELVTRIEGLVGDRGVRRFDGDTFMATEDGAEAEWPLGYAWLATVLSKQVYRDMELGRSRKELDDLIDRAESWVEKLDAVVLPDGSIPELYSGDEPGHASPHGMAHGMYITAVMSIRQSRGEIRNLKS